jgi:hypothetical protein
VFRLSVASNVPPTGLCFFPGAAEHCILEAGPAQQRALVVKWTRTFPFSFLSSREYVIARRLFRVGDTLYGITKVGGGGRGGLRLPCTTGCVFRSGVGVARS